MHKRHRLDSNHKAVVAELERRGYGWIDTSQTNIGFDGLVLVHGRLIPCEIKDPRSTRGLRLTTHEAKVAEHCLRHGVRVELLTGVDDSLDVLERPRRADGRSYDDMQKDGGR